MTKVEVVFCQCKQRKMYSIRLHGACFMPRQRDQKYKAIVSLGIIAKEL